MSTKALLLKIIFIVFSLPCLSQSVVQELSGTAPTNIDDVTFTEKVVVSSRSKRIFILSNSNQSLQPGDLVTVLLQGTKVVRGLIAKVQEEKAALKVMKTYSSQLKSSLRRGVSVKLLRGDESQLNTAAGTDLQIQSAEDLYSSDLLLETEDIPKKKSDLNSNNLLQMGVGMYQGPGEDGDKEFYTHWVFSWNYKVSAFWWFEALYGYSNAKRFPAVDISTDFHNLTLRTKYAFDLPAYSFVMPYFGLQVVAATSSEAGEGYDLTNADQAAIADREQQLVEDANKVVPVIGVTFYKRFVPGWLITLNVGTDVINAGLGIEF